MKFVFLTATTAKEEWHLAAQSLYLKKINPFMPTETRQIQIQKAHRDKLDKKKDIESKLILESLKSDEFVILFDEKGKDYSSETYSQLIEKALLSGKKKCVFIIGGAYGVTEEVKNRANHVVRLAPFVLNHLVAEIVALEQTYRAFTIIKKIPYHNA